MKEFVEQLIAHLKAKKGWCSSRTCGAATDEVRKFAEEYKPRTNADRIRSMDDAELAKHLYLCPVTLGEGDCIHSGEDVHCFDCILEWLQSEVKE